MKYVSSILFLLLILSLISAHNFCYSQEPGTKKEIIIDEVIITGNEVTEKEIILREIESKPGKTLDLVTLKEDVDRLNNLKLFTKVDIIPVPVSNDSMKLIFDVQESFYIIPVPQGGIKEGSLKKVWVGLKLNWKNFRGRNEDLNFSFGIGYEPFVRASYSVPWITQNRFFTSFSAGYSRTYNLIYDTSTAPVNLKDAPRYSADNYNAAVEFGKKFDRSNSLSLGLGYNSINLSEYVIGRTLSPNAKDRYMTLNLNYIRDTRDLFAYPLSGTLVEAGYSKYGIANRYIDFNRMRADVRRYILIKLSDDYAVTWANRVNGIISFGGAIPSYLKEAFGFSRVIRGWDDVAFEGDNLLGVFTELRVPVIQPFFVSGTDIPLIKNISFLKEMSYKFGLYTTLFFDMGGVWNKSDKLSKTQFRRGFGIGLNALLPFNFVGRMDWAFRRENDKYKGQIIFNLGASF
ncbi:MAG TPA: BamA/TamA family outer membrane protein [Ignavibacteria bacterium]|nr:BamA/TamA family outer membrane protein [Ignavibacteria bacterium]